MKLRVPVLFSVLMFTLVLASCGQAPTEHSNESSIQTPAAPTDSDTILFSLDNQMRSGLKSFYPGIMVIDHGRVLAYRTGTEDAGDAIAAIRSGEVVEDAEDRQQEIQLAFDKLLNLEDITSESIASVDENVILLFSPAKSMGECPPCDEVFESIEVGDMIGKFTVKKITIGYR